MFAGVQFHKSAIDCSIASSVTARCDSMLICLVKILYFLKHMLEQARKAVKDLLKFSILLKCLFGCLFKVYSMDPLYWFLVAAPL